MWLRCLPVGHEHSRNIKERLEKSIHHSLFTVIHISPICGTIAFAVFIIFLIVFIDSSISTASFVICVLFGAVSVLCVLLGSRAQVIWSIRQFCCALNEMERLHELVVMEVGGNRLWNKNQCISIPGSLRPFPQNHQTNSHWRTIQVESPAYRHILLSTVCCSVLLRFVVLLCLVEGLFPKITVTLRSINGFYSVIGCRVFTVPKFQSTSASTILQFSVPISVLEQKLLN